MRLVLQCLSLMQTLGLNVSSHANETTVAGAVTGLGASAGTELWVYWSQLEQFP